MPDLLLELFCEEIPARMQRKAAGDLRKAVTDALVESGLTYEGAREYWTPRRLALDIRGVTARSADISEERKGPRTDAPEKAVEGFLRGAGLASVDEAEVRSDPKKGDFYVAVIKKPGRDAEEIIALRAATEPLAVRALAENIACPSNLETLDATATERLTLLTRTAEQLLRLEKRSSSGALTRVRRLSRQLSEITAKFQADRLKTLASVVK